MTSCLSQGTPTGPSWAASLAHRELRSYCQALLAGALVLSDGGTQPAPHCTPFGLAGPCRAPGTPQHAPVSLLPSLLQDGRVSSEEHRVSPQPTCPLRCQHLPAPHPACLGSRRTHGVLPRAPTPGWAAVARGRGWPAGTPGSEHPWGAARCGTLSTGMSAPGVREGRVQAQGWVPPSQLS